MKPDNTIYVSIDIEADGPIPGMNSMLSIGAAAFRLDSREPIATFERNLYPLPEATPDPDTMKWWAGQKEAWDYVTSNQTDPAQAMQDFRAWLEGLPGKPTFVGYPASYDFMFAYWYIIRFTGFPAPFGFQAMDIKTLAAEKLDIPFRQVGKRNMPKRWFEGAPKHTHKALDDAIGQGVLFVNMMADKGRGR